MVSQESAELRPPWGISRPTSGGSESCAVGSPLSLQMGHRGTQQNELYGQVPGRFSTVTGDVKQGYTVGGPLRTVVQ